jgi:branched-chain amino acid transport system permease protein
MPSLEVIVSNVLTGFLLGGILALTALGLSIVLGVMRLVNLAHGEFLVAGAYLGLFLAQFFGLDPLLGLPIVGVVIGLFAFPLHRLLLMPLAGKGLEAPMMTTFGLSIILQNAFIIALTGDTRSITRDYATASLTLGPVAIGRIYVIGFVISVVVILAIHLLISRSAFGRDLRASAADAPAAAVMGVDVRRVYATTFALGAGCAALGGTLIGLTFSFTPTTGGGYLLADFAIIVLGGLGNIFGTLLGGVVLGVLQGLGGAVLGDGYRGLIGLVIFLVALTIRPEGLLTSGKRG